MYVAGLSDKMYGIGANTIASLNVAGVKVNDASELKYASEPTFTISKAGLDIMEFSKSLYDSEVVKEIESTYQEQSEIKLKHEIQKMYEEQGIECPDDTEYNYDESKYSFYAQMSEDIHMMLGAAIAYYKENGSFAGMTSEDISKETKAIEYKDLGLLVELKGEIDRIDKEEFVTEADYYDRLIEKIDKSNLSYKAKESIGGYLEHLKRESQKGPEIIIKNKLSPEEIEKQLAIIKEEMESYKQRIEDSKEIHRKQVDKINKELLKMYKNNYI